MNTEEYFVKEFKKYSEFKNRLLNGADYMNDSRVATIVRAYPQDMQARIANIMFEQMKYLRGADLGCTGGNNFKSCFTEFLEKSLPPSITVLDTSRKVDYCVMLNIQEPYFSELNKSTVKLQPRDTYSKRVTDTDGSFVKDVDGSDLKRDIAIPSGSRVVLSHKNIHLPNQVADERGHKNKYYPSEGFGYIDYVDTPKGRGYLYYIPREYIYPLELNVLLLTASRLTSRFYWGRQYFFNRGTDTVYLYVAPYCSALLKPQNVLFYLKDSLDYDNEIQALEQYWQSTSNPNGTPRPSIMYPVEDMQLQNAMGYSQSGENNLAFRTLPDPDRAPYKRYEKSLAELGEPELIISG